MAGSDWSKEAPPVLEAPEQPQTLPAQEPLRFTYEKGTYSTSLMAATAHKDYTLIEASLRKKPPFGAAASPESTGTTATNEVGQQNQQAGSGV